MNDQLDHAVRSVLADIVDTAPIPADEPVRTLPLDATRPGRGRVLVALAAVTIAAVGVGVVALTGDRAETPAPAAPPAETLAPPPVTAVAESPPSSAPVVCSDAGCVGFDPLPVTPGATDFYVGPAALGTPTISADFFDTLTRCVELTEDFTACDKVEGIAGVNLVGYPTTDGDIAVGTTFADLSPTDYAVAWGPTGGSSVPIDTQPVRVRGHDAIRYMNELAQAVVWQERPGVLVWVTVPTGSDLDPVELAEGVQRVEGPSTILHRVVIAPLADPWEGQSNDGNGLIVAVVGGQECVGLDYVQTCGTTIGSRTIVRTGWDGGVSVAGSTPADVTTVRIVVIAADAAPTEFEVETITFANSASRFYSAVIPAGQVQSVTWLTADGSVVDATPVTVVPPDTGG